MSTGPQPRGSVACTVHRHAAPARTMRSSRSRDAIVPCPGQRCRPRRAAPFSSSTRVGAARRRARRRQSRTTSRSPTCSRCRPAAAPLRLVPRSGAPKPASTKPGRWPGPVWLKARAPRDPRPYAAASCGRAWSAAALPARTGSPARPARPRARARRAGCARTPRSSRRPAAARPQLRRGAPPRAGAACRQRSSRKCRRGRRRTAPRSALRRQVDDRLGRGLRARARHARGANVPASSASSRAATARPAGPAGSRPSPPRTSRARRGQGRATRCASDEAVDPGDEDVQRPVHRAPRRLRRARQYSSMSRSVCSNGIVGLPAGRLRGTWCGRRAGSARREGRSRAGSWRTSIFTLVIAEQQVEHLADAPGLARCRCCRPRRARPSPAPASSRAPCRARR